MLTGEISHEEAVIEHIMEYPELGSQMLKDAIDEGDLIEIRRVQRRITEAETRRNYAVSEDRVSERATLTTQDDYQFTAPATTEGYAYLERMLKLLLGKPAVMS